MGRLKEGPPQTPPTWAAQHPPLLPCLHKLLGARPSRRTERAGAAPPSPCGTSFGTQEEGLGIKLSAISPRLGEGDTTVLSPHSLEQGCLELALVTRLSGVTTPRAAPNLTHSSSSHVSAPTTSTAKRGPSRLGCSTVTLMAIFAFPALLGTVIMLERADMLLPSALISQWPSQCSIPTQTESSGSGSHSGGQWEHRDDKDQKVHPFPEGESALLTGSCSNLQQGRLQASSLDSHRDNQHPPVGLCPLFLAGISPWTP